MYRYVARANIDHYLDLLYEPELAPERRAVIIKLLIEEEDKLGHDLEQLEFAETRAANGRERLRHLRKQLDAAGPADRAQLERVVTNCEAIQHLLDSFSHRLRTKVDSR